MGRTSGLCQAEGQRTTTAAASDLVTIYKLGTDSGQYEPRDITVGNLLTGGSTGFTAGSIIFADTGGDLGQDNTNLYWDDAANTARITNVDLGISGTAGSLDIFPTTSAKGKLAITAADSAGNTTTAIVNASQAGARTYTIPDAGASASFVMSEGAQTINGAKTIPTLITTTFTATNIDAGASGTAGTVDIFPTTALKGKIQIAAVSNTNDDTLTITNAAQAAARTYTIPDGGASAAFMMTQGAQTVVGAQTFSAVATHNANIVLATAGNGLQIKEGANARMGVATLVSGTVTISNTSVGANTRILLNRYSVNSSSALGLLSVGTIVNGTSFIINALKEADATVQTNDVSIVDWVLIEAA